MFGSPAIPCLHISALRGRRGHRRVHLDEISGKPSSPPDFSESVDHCVRRFMHIVEGLVVGEHRNIDLINVTPNSHVEGAAC